MAQEIDRKHLLYGFPHERLANGTIPADIYEQLLRHTGRVPLKKMRTTVERP